MVSLLDSGTEAPRLKSQSRRVGRHSDKGNPLKNPVSGTTPQNFLKQSRIFGGAHVGVKLVVFGNKIAPKGAPKEKINLAPLTPKWGR